MADDFACPPQCGRAIWRHDPEIPDLHPERRDRYPRSPAVVGLTGNHHEARLCPAEKCAKQCRSRRPAAVSQYAEWQGVATDRLTVRRRDAHHARAILPLASQGDEPSWHRPLRQQGRSLLPQYRHIATVAAAQLDGDQQAPGFRHLVQQCDRYVPGGGSDDGSVKWCTGGIATRSVAGDDLDIAQAQRFQVSQTPVREALLELTRSGLIEPMRNRGFRVVEPPIQALSARRRASSWPAP